MHNVERTPACIHVFTCTYVSSLVSITSVVPPPELKELEALFLRSKNGDEEEPRETNQVTIRMPNAHL
jgi:hypothetical protein